jgi:hypothetical protein
MAKRNYHLLNYNPWKDNFLPPRTPAELAEFRERQRIAVEKFEEKKRKEQEKD